MVYEACGPNQPEVLSNSQSGEIQSPNYPINYPEGITCSWHIVADVGKMIVVRFTAFNLEYGYDSTLKFATITISIHAGS